MIKHLVAILGALWLMAALPDPVAAQQTALVVSSCGSQTLIAGRYYAISQDTTGDACGNGGGGGGGGAVTAVAGAFVSGSIVDLLSSGTPCLTPTTSGCREADVSAAILAAVNASIPAGTAIIGKVGIDQTTPGTTNGVVVNSAPDPCFASAKLFADFESTASGGSIITATSGKKAYVCSISIVTSVAANVSVIEGTGSSVCTGGTTAGDYLNTGVTAANGAAFAANGGISRGSGGTEFSNATANQNTCILFTTSGTPQVNVHVSYVVQ